MPKKKRLSTVLALLTAAAVLLSSQVLTISVAAAQSGPLPEGASVTLRNTLQDPGEPEVAFPALFGQPVDAFDEDGTVSSSASEFPTALAQPGTPAGDISGLYDINMAGDSISFTMLPTADDPFWVNVFGEFPAGKFDRYYMTFSQPHNVQSGLSTNDSVTLRVDSPTVLVVEIGSGYDMNPPQEFQIDLTAAADTTELAITGADTGLLAVIGATLAIGGALIVSGARRFD